MSLECDTGNEGRSIDRPGALEARVYGLIKQHPAYDFHRSWAFLRFGEGRLFNMTATDRRTKAPGWMVNQRRRMAERLKDQCTWQTRYATFLEAQGSIARWIP